MNCYNQFQRTMNQRDAVAQASRMKVNNARLSLAMHFGTESPERVRMSE